MILALLLAAAAPDPLVGEWRGPSICQVRPSPCHDEQAVYRIEPDGAGYLVHFAKLVNAVPEEFGAVAGTYDAGRHLLTVVGHGARGDFTWRLRVAGRRLTGALTLPDGTVYRRADLRRVSTG